MIKAKVTFKVLTLNTWGIHGPTARRAVLLAAIRSLDPDILCLQEVTDGDLLESLSYPTQLYAPTSWLALLSRFPVTAQQRLTYQAVSSLEPYRREALVAKLQIGSSDLWVANTHLAWQAGDETTRLAQVEELLQFVAPLGDRLLLGGDLNTPPETVPIQKILKAGFQDLFSSLHPGDSGITWDNRNPFIQSHSVKFPDRRIDYLFLWKNAGQWFTPAKCEVVCQTPNPEDFFPSDHYGVLVSLRLAGNQP